MAGPVYCTSSSIIIYYVFPHIHNNRHANKGWCQLDASSCARPPLGLTPPLSVPVLPYETSWSRIDQQHLPQPIEKRADSPQSVGNNVPAMACQARPSGRATPQLFRTVHQPRELEPLSRKRRGSTKITCNYCKIGNMSMSIRFVVGKPEELFWYTPLCAVLRDVNDSIRSYSSSSPCFRAAYSVLLVSRRLRVCHEPRTKRTDYGVRHRRKHTESQKTRRG